MALGNGMFASTVLSSVAPGGSFTSVWTRRLKRSWRFEITTSRIHDYRVLPDVLSQVTDEIAQVSGDGAYDTRDCFDAVLERDAVPTLLPRRNAKPRASPEQWRLTRNAILKAIEVVGRYEWRVRRGATRQSLGENAVSRWKTILGPGLAARGTDNQTTEAMLKATVLNRMASLGMPESIGVVL